MYARRVLVADGCGASTTCLLLAAATKPGKPCLSVYLSQLGLELGNLSFQLNDPLCQFSHANSL